MAIAKGKRNSLVLFGKRLRGIREASDLTQEQVQYALGIVQSHLARIEAGKLNTGIVHASLLAEFFGLKDYEIFQYDEPLPNADLLKNNVLKFLKANGINPSIFIRKGLVRHIEMLISSTFFDEARYSKEISNELEARFEVKFSTSSISQAMDGLKKKGLIEKVMTDKKSKFQYRRK